MTKSRSAFALLLLSLAGFTAHAGVSPEAFFAPAKDAGAALPASAIYPAGRRLLYSGYSGKPERDLAGGFSATGPFYGKGNEEMAALAAKLNLPFIAQVGAADKNGVASIEAVAARPEAEIRATITEQVTRLGASSSVVMWAVQPEELRPWKKPEMEYLRIACDAIRKADPKHRPIFLYNPNHRDAKTLAPIAAQVDVLGKGCYVNYAGFKEARGWIRYSMEQTLAAAKAAGRDCTPIVMPELAKNPDPADVGKIAAWTRHDVYLGLMSGAKGVLIWSLFPRKEVKDTWPQWYEGYARCGKELTAPGGLGEVFLFGVPKDDLRVVPVEARPDVPLDIASGKAVETTTTKPDEGKSGVIHSWTKAEYAKGASRHLFIANSHPEGTTFRITGFPASGAKAVASFSGSEIALPKDGKPLEVKLAPWEVLAIRFDPAKAR